MVMVRDTEDLDVEAERPAQPMEDGDALAVNLEKMPQGKIGRGEPHEAYGDSERMEIIET